MSLPGAELSFSVGTAVPAPLPKATVSTMSKRFSCRLMNKKCFDTDDPCRQ